MARLRNPDNPKEYIPGVFFDPKPNSTDFGPFVRSMNGVIIRLDSKEAEGILDPMRCIPRSMPDMIITTAVQMLTQITGGANAPRERDMALTSIVGYGMRHGADCTGEAVRMAYEACRKHAPDADTIDPLVEQVAPMLERTYTNSQMFRLIYGHSHGGRHLAVSDGLTLLSAGTMNIISEKEANSGPSDIQRWVVRMAALGASASIIGRNGFLVVDEAWSLLGDRFGISVVNSMGHNPVPSRHNLVPHRPLPATNATQPRNRTSTNGYPDGERGVMGRHQRAETLGLISFLICAMVGAIMMSLYMQFAPAIWQITQRRFMVCAGILAGCAALSFCVGYASHSHSLNLQRGWFAPIRRVFEILALSIVYAATVFLSSFALLGAINGMMGSATFSGYLTPICAGFAGVVGYMTFVQAEMMNAKTLASLLPFFVISGVCTAGLTTDDPYWYHNNFSQLGDRTTFAARMFNSTLMLAGTCIIIVSYFAISELITTERIQRARHQMNKSTGTAADDRDIAHFTLRIAILSLLLTISGLMFIGIGAFRYTPHPIMHNVCAKGLTVIMGVLMLSLPWLAPRIPKVMSVISALAILICSAIGIRMLMGQETLTNLEALAGLLFLGWFIVFSRQIAAIEADRLQDQLMMLQTGTGDSTGAGPGNPARDADGSGTNEQVAELQSRLSNDR